jgi:hypothetical protein
MAVVGRRRAGVEDHEVIIDLPGDDIVLRDLIAAVVAAEINAFERRAEFRTFVRVLTEQSLADGLDSGAVRSGGAEPTAPVDVAAATAAATLAFEDGLYQTYVNDDQIEALDDPVRIDAETRLLFVRLVALAGG